MGFESFKLIEMVLRESILYPTGGVFVDFEQEIINSGKRMVSVIFIVFEMG